MSEIILESYCDVKPPEFNGWLRLYHDVNHIKDVYVKQVEINKILEYSRGCVCADIDDSLIIKIHDENRRLMNFVSVSCAQDYIECLPTTGKRRKLARDLSMFFKELFACIMSFDGLPAIKTKFECREIVDCDDNAEKECYKDRIKSLTKENDALKTTIKGMMACFLGLRDNIGCNILDTFSQMRDLIGGNEDAE